MTDFHFWGLVYNPLQLFGKRFLGNLNVLLRRRHEFASHKASEYADEAIQTGITHLLCSGDFTSTSTEPEMLAAARFVQQLEDRGLQPHVIPGNHDVYTFEARWNRRFERHFEKWMPEEGLPARRTLPGGTPLILVPTAVPNLLSSKGRITAVEVEAVAELVRQAPSPLLVSGHYPILNKTHGYNTPPDRRLRNAEALHRVLGESKKRILYAAGHVHRFSYTQDAEYPNLYHLTTGAFFRAAHETESHGEFSEIHVYPEHFAVTRHRLYDTWLRTEETPQLGDTATLRA